MRRMFLFVNNLQVRYALHFLASKAYGGPGDGSKKSNAMASFMEQHILGLMAHFSDFINNTQGWHSTSEKKLCLKGIEEMICVGKRNIFAGLPQVSALIDQFWMWGL
jgi:serine/threonine-protein kinase ATR